MRLAIADPPYPPEYAERRDRPGGNVRVTTRSRAQRYYSAHGVRAHNDRAADHHERAHEWDDPARHRALLEQLMDEFDGWAIATSMDGVECYRPLPIPARKLLIWHKPNGQAGNGRTDSKNEAVIVYPPEGRRARTGPGALGQVPGLLIEPVATHSGFPGAKPPAWTRWVLDALSYDPATDTVEDLFPGSGAVSAAIRQDVLL